MNTPSSGKGNLKVLQREYGVGFAIRNSIKKSTLQKGRVTERLIALEIQTKAVAITLICAYAPTLLADPEAKDDFYSELEALVDSFPPDSHLILLGDFNARIGKDHIAWPSCLGQFGIGKMNENGQRLLELCTFNHLCITNTFFQSSVSHKVSWRHPRSKALHQIDHIITQRSFLNNINISCTYHSAICDTDHSLVGCTIKIHSKPNFINSKPQPKNNLENVKVPEQAALFQLLLEKNIKEPSLETSPEEYWQNIKETTLRSKPMAKLQRRTRNDLMLTRSDVQRTVRACVNEYWEELSTTIQIDADTGNIRGMYEGIRKAFGLTVRKTAPIKYISGNSLTSREDQLNRWVEHFSSIYSVENQVSETVLECVRSFPPMNELDVPPTLEELKKAIENLLVRKATGEYGISGEVIKSGGHILTNHLHIILCMCWEKSIIPQDLKDANIITLYKNKGDRGNCDNYRGISLLSIVGKVFGRVVFERLLVLADRVYPESQCGFRPKGSTVDMIFTLRLLQEKCKEKQQPLYLVFIDLSKTFDLVSRDGLFKILYHVDCLPKQQIIRAFHDGMQAHVIYEGSKSRPFDAKSGVKQGDVPASTLFGIFFAVVLMHAFANYQSGIHLNGRMDGKLLNRSRLKAITKIRDFLLRELLYADDACFCDLLDEGLQIMMDAFSNSCKEFSLSINQPKTKILVQGVNEAPNILLYNTSFEV
ncbi:uncharacterized protein LOC117122714 [Anneissia japonica]|uniref:uncharacterized protein LOC117122714 n=1 Tax=Anneissia japonica TaxID=1529436 RepID=UPI0014255A65|nr:uncharacterized protein LOC117122714 [Anneissia japonica]